MQNYAMEFKKFSARKLRASFPITAIKMHQTLCQDVLFDLNSRFIEVNPYKFSRAFFYDFNKITQGVDWSRIYVLDGVEYLHRQAQTDKPLVRDRALYSFLYLVEESDSAFAEALITNPWLNNLCKAPMRLLSQRVAVIKSQISSIAAVNIYKSILDDLDSGFTPRGVWGLDYMFMWKHANRPPLYELNNEISLIPLDEYINSFSKE